MSKKLQYSAIGLRDATPEEISNIKKRYPFGVHVTHKLSGEKLPFNGVYYTRVSPRLQKWAKVKEKL